MTEVVEQSWKRCNEASLKPTEKAYDQIISTSRITELQQENHSLIAGCLPLFEKLAPFLSRVGYIALLTDRAGTIIYTAGDPGFATQAQKVQLQIGANWKEDNKGTNAIGTALVEEVPVNVHGEQHFFVENHFLTCSAAPVFSPDGKLLGVINLSTRKEQVDPFALSLACMTSDALQNRLLVLSSSAEQIVTIEHRSEAPANNALPLISLDEENRVVKANRAATNLLGADCFGKEFLLQDDRKPKTLKDRPRQIWHFSASPAPASRIAGSCPLIRQAKTLAQKAAQFDYPVLLLGESGTGKELFAQMIHETGPRASQPFIAVNCSAISENLIESELFGYEAGAFTGALREGRIGKFEAAKQGTIFLDEIGDMSLKAQAALLRVLQEKTVTPVGGNTPRKIHARVIAATHRNLSAEIRAGRFRADLYYRLKGIMITLPPLRKRSDIIPLAEHLLRQLTHTKAVLSKEAKVILQSHHWPGNIRELQGVLIQAAFLADEEEIGSEHIQLEGVEADGGAIEAAAPKSLREAEIEAIHRSLRASGGNVSKAAKLLQIGRNTLYRKMEEYRLGLGADFRHNGSIT